MFYPSIYLELSNFPQHGINTPIVVLSEPVVDGGELQGVPYYHVVVRVVCKAHWVQELLRFWQLHNLGTISVRGEGGLRNYRCCDQYST